MEEKIIELIITLKDINSSDDIALACTIVSCVIAVISLLVSLSIFFLQIKDRVLKKRVLGYIYQYFAPEYKADDLPTTQQIENDLKNIFFWKKDIFDTVIELNKEKLISAVGDSSSNLPNIKWKPNTIYEIERNINIT